MHVQMFWGSLRLVFECCGGVSKRVVFSIINKSMGSEFLKYFGVSVFSFVVDFLVFLFFFSVIEFSPYFSTIFGFIAGAVFSYQLSIKYVFKFRGFEAAPGLELSVFIVLGVVGLLITQLSLWFFIAAADFSGESARFFSALITFVVNYFFRKVILFTKSASDVVVKV